MITTISQILEIETADLGAEDSLPLEIRELALGGYSDASLAGRLTYYRRELLFERSPSRARDLRDEIVKTEDEIAARKAARALAAAQQLAEFAAAAV